MSSPAKLSSAFTCHVPKAYVIKRNSLFKLKYKRIKQLLCLREPWEACEIKQKAVVKPYKLFEKNHQTTIFIRP